MGRVNVAGQPTLSPSSPLTHFSHPHPLYPTPIHNPAQAPPCSACDLQTQSPTYTCQICSFTLHQSCAQLPKFITHASHGGAGCTMALLTKPIYPGAVFSCDACADKGSAWSYHCERCSFDLHVTCAVKPLKIRHRAHVSCELHLTFESPYAGSDEFRCDICQRISSKQWLYRCGSCGFDIHMDCNRAVISNVHQSNHQMTHSASNGSVNYQPYHHQLQPPHLLMHSASTGGAINYQQVQAQAQAQAPRPYQVMPGVNHGGVVMGNQPMINQYGPPNNNNNLGGNNNLMMTAVDGLVNGVFQGIGQTMAQDIMGGGGGGGGGGGDAGGGGGGGDGSGGDASAY